MKQYGATEAAKAAGVSRATIYRAIANGRLKPSANKHGKLKLEAKDVEAYVLLRRAWYAAATASA